VTVGAPDFFVTHNGEVLVGHLCDAIGVWRSGTHGNIFEILEARARERERQGHKQKKINYYITSHQIEKRQHRAHNISEN
jgi:hypothetical protein